MHTVHDTERTNTYHAVVVAVVCITFATVYFTAYCNKLCTVLGTNILEK